MGQAINKPRKRITARVSDNVRVIERESVIRLSQNDARTVLSLFDNPPKPNKLLKDAVKAFKGTMRA